jgi:uncharacterized protein YrrD
VIGIFRINDIIDLPMVDRISAQRLSTIGDVIIDLRENRVYALVCRKRFFKRSLEAVPFKNVTEISLNSVEVNSKLNPIRLRELSIKYRRFQSCQNIMGKMVLSSRGENLGIVRDILIDSNSGIIKAYELSEGYIDDFLTGRHIIELDCGHKLAGKNVELKEYSAQCFLNGK